MLHVLARKQAIHRGSFHSNTLFSLLADVGLSFILSIVLFPSSPHFYTLENKLPHLQLN